MMGRSVEMAMTASNKAAVVKWLLPAQTGHWKQQRIFSAKQSR
jgi:hypothetical protein